MGELAQLSAIKRYDVITHNNRATIYIDVDATNYIDDATILINCDRQFLWSALQTSFSKRFTEIIYYKYLY